MLIAVVSDTHLPRGRRALPDRCVSLLDEAELILHAGDLTTLAVLEQLSGFQAPFVAVHGNVDERPVVERLPAEVELEIDGVSLAMIHDAGPARGRPARLRERFPNADAVVFGHSHIPLLAVEHGLQIFNPGSPTDRRRQAQHTMGVAHVEHGAVRFEHVPLER